MNQEIFFSGLRKRKGLALIIYTLIVMAIADVFLIKSPFVLNRMYLRNSYTPSTQYMICRYSQVLSIQKGKE